MKELRVKEESALAEENYELGKILKLWACHPQQQYKYSVCYYVLALSKYQLCMFLALVM